MLVKILFFPLGEHFNLIDRFEVTLYALPVSLHCQSVTVLASFLPFETKHDCAHL